MRHQTTVSGTVAPPISERPFEDPFRAIRDTFSGMLKVCHLPVV
jgi:hypothetical protein